ncbi:MAG: hypothetical protein OXP69_19535 [Spirochaetaceae bacterium]|nr:hypothetical protein [Spirochaetaceae bacterium]
MSDYWAFQLPVAVANLFASRLTIAIPVGVENARVLDCLFPRLHRPHRQGLTVAETVGVGTG